MVSDDRLQSRPIREGLFEFDPPRLIGSVCQDCHIRTFPAREFCPSCGSEHIEAGTSLAATGRLYSFTTVRQAPSGRSTPYNLGYIDLDDNVRVMAQVEGDPGTLHIGMPLRLKLRPVGHQQDFDLIGYVFVPAANDRENSK